MCISVCARHIQKFNTHRRHYQSLGKWAHTQRATQIATDSEKRQIIKITSDFQSCCTRCIAELLCVRFDWKTLFLWYHFLEIPVMMKMSKDISVHSLQFWPENAKLTAAWRLNFNHESNMERCPKRWFSVSFISPLCLYCFMAQA